jgi:hypothetical protein
MKNFVFFSFKNLFKVIKISPLISFTFRLRFLFAKLFFKKFNETDFFPASFKKSLSFFLSPCKITLGTLNSPNLSKA